MPEGLTSIGVAAFYISGLTSITIPSSVNHMSLAAFNLCSNHMVIRFEGDCPLDEIFDYCGLGEAYFHGEVIFPANNDGASYNLTSCGDGKSLYFIS